MESLFASAKHLADEQAVTIKAVRKDLPAKMKKFVDETTLERFFNRRLAVSCAGAANLYSYRL